MTERIKLITIIALAVCFMLSPLVFPDSPQIWERLMYGFLAACGLGIGVPVVASGVKALSKRASVGYGRQLRRRQKVRGAVNVADILTAYQEAFNIPWWRMLLSTLATTLGIGGIFRLADASYREMTDEDEQRFFEFLKKDKTDQEQYVAEDFDCDDFEFRLHGEVHKDLAFAAMPIFITWVSWEVTGNWFKRAWTRLKYFVTGARAGHAVKSYYKGGIVKIVEPQNDDVYYVPTNWRLDLLCG